MADTRQDGILLLASPPNARVHLLLPTEKGKPGVGYCLLLRHGPGGTAILVHLDVDIGPLGWHCRG